MAFVSNAASDKSVRLFFLQSAAFIYFSLFLFVCLYTYLFVNLLIYLFVKVVRSQLQQSSFSDKLSLTNNV